ncbi:hypothetical protein VISI1226_02435 [Vibrio sinaloensis DSM 21326]|uniref:Uncharacterized protein n=1 Tax=Vibrio sinaloensis DSM 21326 TaxID=945550 RepID=E8M1U1_PHOS4|nr:hypothetical protein VISI1226_02435 [Vibrio sinaloensis DSM 21326]
MEKKLLYPTVETKGQYRSGLFFSFDTRRMVDIVHKSLQINCHSGSARMITKLASKNRLLNKLYFDIEANREG